MRPTLHDYQAVAIERTRDALLDVNRALVVAPTGAGKTTMFSEIICRSTERGNPVLVIAHRKELITQASARLDLFGVDHGIIMPGTRRAKPSALVQVASIQTLVRRQLPPASVVILDEAHRAKAASNMQVIESYPNATKILGFTATPWRLDGSGLGDVFHALIQVCQPRDLIDRANPVLVEPRVFAPSEPDMGGVKLSQGDYDRKQSAERMANQASVDEIVRNWQLRASDRQTVVFATGVQHSYMIRDAFREAGVVTEHLDGNTPAAERDRILSAFAAGRVQVVTNCEILTEGWDYPACGCAVLARPTQSLSLYLQMVGRVLRVAPGKPDAVILDHAGNTLRHGFPTDDREWDLAGRKRGAKGSAPIKTCPECYACVPSAASVCPECDYAWPTAVAGGSVEAARNVELVEIKRSERPPLPALEKRDRWLGQYRLDRDPTQEEKQALYDLLVEKCITGGRMTGWVWWKYKLVFGKEPRNLLAMCPYREEFLAKKEAERIAKGEVS